MKQDELNKLRLAAGLAPKYDREERKHLEEKEAQKAAEQKHLSEAANNRAPANLLAEIARRHLNIRSLATQNSDDKDFHEVSVWALEAALKAAFKAGQQAAPKPRQVKEGDESKAEAKRGGSDYDPKGGERYPEDDCCDPDDKEKVETPKKGKSAENYKTPKNKSAKQVAEAKKADKDYDKDGKLETSEEEHKGVVDKKIKAKKKDVKEAYPYPLSTTTARLKEIVKTGKPEAEDVKAARAELKRRNEKVDEVWDLDKAKKNAEEYKKRNKVEAKGSIAKAAKKKKVNEMDLELDMGDAGGADDMKARRMDLIRRAADKVRGEQGIVDVGDEMDDDSALAAMDEPQMDDPGYRAGDEMDELDMDYHEMTGDDDDFEWGEEDCEMAIGAFHPEDEEAFAGGFDAFRRGEMEPEGCGDDFHNGYQTARMTRMSSVAESSSKGYNNPKGTKLKADAKSGANEKKGDAMKAPHKCDSRSAKSEDKGKKGLKKIGEASEDATVFDKDYHHPAGANGHLDMAQHKGEPHVQGRGQEESVKVPADVKKALKEEIAKLMEDSGKIRYRDELRADFYENTAKAFELLLAHLEEGTKHSLLLAQVDMNRVMSPMVERLPRNVYMYIVRGGKPASLNELFREVKVKAEKGADPSKEDYTK